LIQAAAEGFTIVRTKEKPPSTGSICPVIQLTSSDKSQAIVAAVVRKHPIGGSQALVR
jgi:hypothetical protein